VDRSERNEETAYQINAHLLHSICESVDGTRDPKWMGQDVVHVGSALEYGTISGNLAEDSVPNPTTLYGKSKLAGTHTLANCCKALGIRGLTARLFTIYGPGEHPGRLLPSLLETARTGNSLKLTAGNQERDFTYVEDVAEGLLRLGLSQTEPGEVVNLATGKLTPVRHFAETAARILQIPSQALNFGQIPTRTEEMAHSEVVTKSLLHLTSWTPPTRIEEGIKKTKHFENPRSDRRNSSE
jgi:nucleoside-diphosphate-sugar epimerase